MRASILIFLAAGAGLAGECSLDPGAVLHVRVPASVHLRPGVPLRGVLARPVYCGFQAAFAAATPVEIVPGREQPASGSRKGLRRIFGPRDGVRAIPLRMSRLEPPGRKAVDFRATALSGRWVARPADCRGCLTIRIEEALHFAGLPNPPATAVRIPAGTSARVALLSPVSASRTSADEVVRASLAQPLYIEGNPALPAGTLFEARMLEKVVARRLHRRGRFRLGFQGVRLPGGRKVPASASVSAIDPGTRRGVRLDAEGGVRVKAGILRSTLMLAGSYALGKVVDDLLEEGLKWGFGEAISGTAVVAARYTGIAAGAAFFLLQKGPDAVLPQYSELVVVFDRSFTLPGDTDTGKDGR